MDLMGEAGVVIEEDLAEAWGMFQSALLSSPSARIAGGSDEILRNIIAERVLGLPSDIRVDKGMPFNQVPTGRR
jgi:acyl-CoA dehydrogenase